MMGGVSWFLLAALPVVAVAAPKDKGSGWAVRGAPYRVFLHAGEAPGVPEAGWEVQLPDFGVSRQDMRDLVLLGADGKEIALDPVWRGAGRTMLLLAESMPAEEGRATLYFGGGTSRQSRGWTARRSLLLETRRLPQGMKVGSFREWQEAWKKAKVVDGAGFVPLVFHGDNPFGNSDHFLSRYVGILKTGEGGARSFYTLSDDVSYVTIDGRPAIGWGKQQPPPLDPRQVPVAKVSLPSETARVEYCHAVGDPPTAMVLGWDQGGKLGNVPPEAWVHPGKVNVGRVESADGAPVPLGRLKAEQYLGFGDEWYVRIHCECDAPGPDWQVEWVWPDGRVDQGADVKRVWMRLDPLRVMLRFRGKERVIEGWRELLVPRNMDAASVNHDRQRESFLSLLESEDPTKLDEVSRRAGFVLTRAFQPGHVAARWAEAWLAVAKPEDGKWADAMSTAVRETARHDPKAALARLDGLSPEARKAMANSASVLELDIRVFHLKDPMVVGLVSRLSKSGDKRLAALAKNRLGDYQLLCGRTEEAARCYAEAADLSAERRFPVIDRSHSLAIEELVNGNHPDEAQAKFNEWERQHPAAKLDGDMLLWRARVMFLAGDWERALQDLETSLKVRPGSPEEIEVLFWQGRALFELGRKDDARKVWNALVKDYPKHERAEAARQWARKP